MYSAYGKITYAYRAYVRLKNNVRTARIRSNCHRLSAINPVL